MRMQALLVFWLPVLVGNSAAQEPGVHSSEWLNWDKVEAENTISHAPFEPCDNKHGPALLQCPLHLRCHLQHNLSPPHPQQSPVAQQAHYTALHGDNQPDLCFHQFQW